MCDIKITKYWVKSKEKQTKLLKYAEISKNSTQEK